MLENRRRPSILESYLESENCCTGQTIFHPEKHDNWVQTCWKLWKILILVMDTPKLVSSSFAKDSFLCPYIRRFLNPLLLLSLHVDKFYGFLSCWFFFKIDPYQRSARGLNFPPRTLVLPELWLRTYVPEMNAITHDNARRMQISSPRQRNSSQTPPVGKQRAVGRVCLDILTLKFEEKDCLDQ